MELLASWEDAATAAMQAAIAAHMIAQIMNPWPLVASGIVLSPLAEGRLERGHVLRQHLPAKVERGGIAGIHEASVEGEDHALACRTDLR
jgi:hypothetical protein